MAHMDMSGMDGMDGMGDSSGSSSGSSSSTMAMLMAMVFQTDIQTPLYANSWTPHSTGAYAGTCIFLIVLTVIARLLVAFKGRQERIWADQNAQRRYVVVNGKEPISERLSRDPDAKQMNMMLSENGVEEKVFVVERKHSAAQPWRFSVDPARAALDTVIVGVGYLLMLAVMTMNVGYFMSVLGGTFLGSLLVGRYSSLPYH
ncbi:ctr copper transporter [Trichoderma arundinaceum]|uniref:Copper transport protein n=1 Tax=Trichoderma arundinaceum TaxID=490622 RepID=A0A395NTU6_TRIAR|nr:ctr copper transporter [Trichoderma arundinaceum]